MRRKLDLVVIFTHYLKLISRTLTKPTFRGCKVFSRIPQHSPSDWTPHVIPKPQYSHGGSHLSLLHPRPLIFFCSLLPLAHPHAGVPGKLPSESPLAGALAQASSLERGPSMGNLGAGVSLRAYYPLPVTRTRTTRNRTQTTQTRTTRC
jgi:hypothetical protein